MGFMNPPRGSWLSRNSSKRTNADAVLGVMLSHSNVVANMYMVENCEGTILHWKRDRVLSILPFYHIYGMYFSVIFF